MTGVCRFHCYNLGVTKRLWYGTIMLSFLTFTTLQSFNCNSSLTSGKFLEKRIFLKTDITAETHRKLCLQKWNTLWGSPANSELTQRRQVITATGQNGDIKTATKKPSRNGDKPYNECDCVSVDLNAVSLRGREDHREDHHNHTSLCIQSRNQQSQHRSSPNLLWLRQLCNRGH